MKLIVISSSTEINDEIATITALCESGLKYFHLRKPGYSRDKLERLLQDITPNCLPNIMIHQCHELINSYPLGGIHHTSATDFNPDLPRTIHQSKSFHQLGEISGNPHPYNYVFLSPIYDSISKQGYAAKFKFTELARFLPNQQGVREIIALGGVEADKIGELHQLGFDGVAVLGAIWRSVTVRERLEKFREIVGAIDGL
ncbi:MAG TPA: thiamine phosphate synthase [Oscillatoriaceae cyanobacterium M33_DOE_052]|uniref:Thiamine phosphate synthase n=1 Tax=Planktothricoides sp. SpSt-374 TaxID=2282167 RepID=A0A7C3ZZ79_9CYAN|nr:thiamine phosphate synthase [Oscillatoriaceae cyanobacterium M33_DOE_052]